jgi:hypothetical protein
LRGIGLKVNNYLLANNGKDKYRKIREMGRIVYLVPGFWFLVLALRNRELGTYD